MNKPLQFYKSEELTYEQELLSLNKKLARSSLLRLLIFLATAFIIYFFFGSLKVVLPLTLIGIILFIYLVIKHTNLQYKRDLKKKLVEFNALEIKVLNRDYLSLDEGYEFMDPTHFYSYDIDLFGRGSFFQYINRTVTSDGKNELAKNLMANKILAIDNKQEVLKELAQIPRWRQHFSAIASLIKVQHPAKEIVDWIHNYKMVFRRFLSYLPVAFSIISIFLIVLAGIKIISGQFVVIWFFFGLGISGRYLKKVNKIYEDASKAKDTFKQYHKLFRKIEETKFTSQILKKKQQEIQIESQNASVIFLKFSRILNALDQRNNMIMAVVGNAFLLWDIHNSYKIEQWIKRYNDKVENWFKIIAFFDAKNSLANVVFNHPEYVFPEISKNKEVIKAQNLGHPLLNETQRVDNTFSIENHQFYIITGANMAGKSTFLRTVSLAIVMANMGLPVCAESLQYSPIKLITSMRTSDSLADDESYFFSELKRLKFIVDEIKAEKYFIVLDEILKGTNSTDKAIGSKKFVQKLVASNSTGIIATHDLSLCEIGKELSVIENFYFDAEIIDDELYFDYKLKKGICKNMNASFLLKKMDIV